MSDTMRAVRLADRVASSLLRTIREQDLQPGHRLPTEREIGEQYGVSRTVVREATRLLLARGIVEVGSGRGLVVARVAGDTASESLGLYLMGRVAEDYRDVHEVRDLLEVHAARRAAGDADRQALLALREAHERMTALPADDLEALAAADIAFHRALAGACGNDVVGVLLDAVGPGLIAPRRTNLATDGGRREALASHAAILAAVAAGDGDGAAEAMRRHLDAVIAQWEASDG